PVLLLSTLGMHLRNLHSHPRCTVVMQQMPPSPRWFGFVAPVAVAMVVIVCGTAPVWVGVGVVLVLSSLLQPLYICLVRHSTDCRPRASALTTKAPSPPFMRFEQGAGARLPGQPVGHKWVSLRCKA
ncbi:unnamed protein product, partial [Closterium sp. Naga37s-1]